MAALREREMMMRVKGLEVIAIGIENVLDLTCRVFVLGPRQLTIDI